MTTPTEDRVRAALRARAEDTDVREFQFSNTVLDTTPYEDRPRWSESMLIVAAACVVVIGVIGLLVVLPIDDTSPSDTAAPPTTTGAQLPDSVDLRPPLFTGTDPVRALPSDESQALADAADAVLADTFADYRVLEHDSRTVDGVTLHRAVARGDQGRLYFGDADRAVLDDVIDRLVLVESTENGQVYAWPDRGSSNRTVALVSETSVVIVDSEAFTLDGEALPQSSLIELVERLAPQIGRA